MANVKTSDEVPAQALTGVELLRGVQNGANMKTTTGDIAALAANTIKSRLINTTAPLVGGGDLSADRTFSITPASGVSAGSMSAADFTKVSNQSGTNTGDETGAGIRTKLGIATLSGSNTGDQTSVTGNAGTATKLLTARTINGVSFDGTANIIMPLFTLSANGDVPAPITATGRYLRDDGTWVAVAGAGTVTSVSVVTANGVSGSVANATTTPAITVTLGAITPTSVAASGTITGSNLSGTNTGDQNLSAYATTSAMNTAVDPLRDIPVVGSTAARTLALTDRGGVASNTVGGFVIPANATIAFPIGSTVVLYNDSATAQAVTITTDTLRQAGTANVGARTLAGYGQATLLKVSATFWTIAGAGVS